MVLWIYVCVCVCVPRTWLSSSQAEWARVGERVKETPFEGKEVGREREMRNEPANLMLNLKLSHVRSALWLTWEQCCVCQEPSCLLDVPSCLPCGDLGLIRAPASSLLSPSSVPWNLSPTPRVCNSYPGDSFLSFLLFGSLS